jgi:hypothetical protein
MLMTLKNALAIVLAATLIRGGLAAGRDDLEGVYPDEAQVALAWVGDSLVLAAPDGIRLAKPGAGAMAFEPFFMPTEGCLPVLASSGGFLAGLTRGGEVVVWDLDSAQELARRPGGLALADAPRPPVLALADGGMRLLIGDGGRSLFRLALDSPLPMPVGYPGPGTIEALGIQPDGLLRVLPSRWTWSPTTGAWTEAEALVFHSAGGHNRLAWAPKHDLLVTFRRERPMLLGIPGGGLIDLGYREAMDMALDPAGTVALVSFPGTEPAPGADETVLLGSLESFDATTGERLFVLPREGAPTAPNEAADHHTFGLGLEVAALGSGRFATVDFVDHQGMPSLYLRLRGADLVATAELALDHGTWPVHLTADGGLLAVVYEEQIVDVFDVATLGSDSTPIQSLEISAQDDPTGQRVPAARDVFALSLDGGLLAMCGPEGTVFFADPRTGWPHQVVSVNLPKGAGRPLGARFGLDGGLTLVTEDEAGLFERTLDGAQVRWSEPIAVAAAGEVSLDGKVRVELHHGAPGNLDVYRGVAASGDLYGHLVARREVGPAPLDALAISETGQLAWARDGQVLHAELELRKPDAPR